MSGIRRNHNIQTNVRLLVNAWIRQEINTPETFNFTLLSMKSVTNKNLNNPISMNIKHFFIKKLNRYKPALAHFNKKNVL